ncbi:glycosyltransferase [Candidatus Aminicenantes bacterium AC-708-I09]|nr:glycosyltransferase [Candidatus Aminicenantes bacterium AC-708-I09]
MNVYIRELSSELSNFPNLNIDIFTRIQDRKLEGIRYISDKVRIIHIKGGPAQYIDKKNLYKHIGEFSKRLLEFISLNGISYEIIYSHYWLSGLIGEKIKRKFKIPLVHNYHTLAFLKKKAIKREYRENPNRIKMEEFLLNVCDKIILSSENEKENILKEYKIPCWKLKIIYPGVNYKIFYSVDKLIARKSLRINHQNKIVLYVGRIEPVKGLFTIIKALNIIKREKISELENLKLIVVGGGKRESDFQRNSEISKIMDFINENNIGDKVIFIGSREQNDLRNYYSASDALIVPSLYESFGLVTIEALACGTPVIASKIGELRKIIHENKNGLYFTPDNPASLVETILYFYKNRASLWKRDKIRKDIINKFTWEKTAEETFNLFKKILKIYKFEKRAYLPPNYNTMKSFC